MTSNVTSVDPTTGDPGGGPAGPPKSVGESGVKRWAPKEGVHLRTYNLLRWSMPVLLLWLAVAVVGAWIDSGLDKPLTSISAYYYTDAQTVFVGVVIGLGVLLVVIEGRTPWEDALMNTAGALAPFVALLPTPVSESDKCIASYCTSRFLKGTIPDNSELIEFNVWSAVPIWLVLCGYLAYRAINSHGDEEEGASSKFSALAPLLFGVVGLALWVSDTRRELFHDYAHLTSAGVMVVLLIVSIIPFARWFGHRKGFPRWRMLNNSFWLMLWLILALIAGWALTWAVFIPQWDHKVMVIEIIALAPFAVYWMMQGWALRGEEPPSADSPAEQQP